MRTSFRSIPPALLLLLAVQTPAVRAQACEPQWLPSFGQPAGFNQAGYALAVFDDGTGAALYVGGGFTTAGGAPANCLAKWDGRSWSAVGAGIDGASFPAVEALAVFDDGSGPALYVGGRFDTAGGELASGIARWDGRAWSTLGSGVGGTVSALAVHDDGTGPGLYAAGSFHDAGGLTAHKIARWDGATWSSLGLGLGTDPYGANALVVFDDGNGEALYVGGAFGTAGGMPAKSVAKWSSTWDGISWSMAWEPLGGGLIGPVHALAVYDDGDGAALYAGGRLEAGGGLTSMLARWEGSSWTLLALAPGTCESLFVHDDGSGEALFAGGNFSSIEGVLADCIAKFDGTSWSAVGGGIPSFNARVRALAAYDDGAGARLYATGLFGSAGAVTANHVARWDGASWQGLGSGTNGTVRALTVHDDGAGPALYAGGEFTQAGGALVHHVAKWDGTSWSPLGSGMDGPVLALEVYVQGGNEVLCAGGAFTTAGGVSAPRVAAWDGQAWSMLGDGMDLSASSEVRCFAVYDDGDGADLYAGGAFTSADGSPASRIARWDGAAWSALGVGVNNAVEALVVHDDGAGPALYAGGRFTTAGGMSASRIARWNGASWSTLGSGMTGGSTPYVNALTVYDDGVGAALYAGGGFTSAGGVVVNRVARWDGAAWSALGTGVNAVVSALRVVDDGAGAALYAGGSFTTAGGAAANRVARWVGGAWSPLGSGVGPAGSSVMALTAHDDGGGAALFAGGSLLTAGSLPAHRVAKWDLCATTPPPSAWTDVGGGKPGTGRVIPQLVGSGSFAGGSANALALSQSLPGTTATLIVGVAALNAPFKGGTLVPSPTWMISGLPLDGAGAFLLPFTWPSGFPAGIVLWFQCWIADPGATLGLSASNGVRGETP